jgi:hypothetical protein
MIRSHIHRMLLGACLVASSALACGALAQDRDDTKKAQSGYTAGQTRAADRDADDQNRMQGRNDHDADDRSRALGRNARNDHDADDHARALGRNARNDRDADDRMQARNSNHDTDDRSATAPRDTDDRSKRQ